MPPPASRPLSPRAAVIMLALVVVVWGVNWPVMKTGLQHIGPMTFAAARIGLGGLTMFIGLAAAGRLVWPTRHDLPLILSVSLLHMVGFLVLVNTGLLFVDAGRSAILAYTTPLWVVPGAVWLLGERLSRLKVAGLATGLAGVAVLFNPLGFDWTHPDTLIGNGCLMLAALLWALAILHIRAHRWVTGPIELSPWQFLVGSLVLVPLAYVLEGSRPIDFTPELIAILAFNGPIASAFGFIAQILVARSLPAVTTSLGLLAVPMAGLLFSAWLLGETIDVTRGLGLVLIIGGLALVAWADRPRSSAQRA
ncbi:MAG: DMT family transporter [Rhodospirillaceae bacterium]|nr:DMT family transporter [Rhodospirillaceae bacterium]